MYNVDHEESEWLRNTGVTEEVVLPETVAKISIDRSLVIYSIMIFTCLMSAGIMVLENNALR